MEKVWPLPRCLKQMASGRLHVGDVSICRPMSKAEQHYLSYILRLWAETHESDLVWRASLEDVQSGERIGFSGLAGLILFLEAKGVMPASEWSVMCPGTIQDGN